MDKLTILFYPDRLDNKKRFSRLYRILKGRSDIVFHNDPSKPFDLHIFWSYTRHSIVPDKITLNCPNVINRGCWNIGKEKVNRIFDDLFIDPLKHKGVCVEKLDQQGKHKFHKIINCPQHPKTGYVYQRLINSKENGLFVRYRAYWMDKITHIRKIYQAHPFETKVIKSEEIGIRDLFTHEQEVDFGNKCRAFGVNLAEMDVLWDGKPVVIDVNNVVGGNHVPMLTNALTKKIDDEIIEYFYGKMGK